MEKLFGYARTSLVRTSETTGEHLRRITERDWRDGRDVGWFKVRSSRFSELRTPNFELRIAPFSHVSRFTRHGLWLLADFFSILLQRRRGFSRGKGFEQHLVGDLGETRAVRVKVGEHLR